MTKETAKRVRVTPEGVHCEWCGGRAEERLDPQWARDNWLLTINALHRWDHRNVWPGGRCLMCALARDRVVAERDAPYWPQWHAFEVAIACERADDMTRLVFADWLEDQGWPDQAALWRPQPKGDS